MKKGELFEVTIKMSSIFLYRDDLLALEDLLQKNIDNLDARPDNLKIDIEQPNKSVRLNSFMDLRDYDLESTQSIKIYAVNWHNDSEGKFLHDKSIRVNIRPLAGEIIIDGDNELWVYGMEKTIQSFLDKKRTFINRIYRFYGWIMPMLIGMIAGIFLPLLLRGIFHDDNKAILISSLMIILIGLLGYWLNKLLGRWIKFAEIHFIERQQVKRLSTSDKIQIFGIILGVVSALIFFLLEQQK